VRLRTAAPYPFSTFPNLQHHTPSQPYPICSIISFSTVPSLQHHTPLNLSPSSTSHPFSTSRTCSTLFLLNPSSFAASYPFSIFPRRQVHIPPQSFPICSIIPLLNPSTLPLLPIYSIKTPSQPIALHYHYTASYPFSTFPHLQHG
jgi:hypothetical protein